MGCGGSSKLSVSDALILIVIAVIPTAVHITSFLLNNSPASWTMSIMMLMVEFMLLIFLALPSKRLNEVGALGIVIYTMLYPLFYFATPISYTFAVLLVLTYATSVVMIIVSDLLD